MKFLNDLTVSSTGGFNDDVSVPFEGYGVGWSGSLEVPTKKSIYDKIESIPVGSGLTFSQIYSLTALSI